MSQAPTFPAAHPVVIFRGTHRATLELALVLESKAIAFEMVDFESTWFLLVSPDLVECARDELEGYTKERSAPMVSAPLFRPYTGTTIGAIGYAFILLIVAYLAGINCFGVDWYAIGALDAGAGHGREWWRALTALTLHVDQVHLLGNLLFGIVAGSLVSTLFGPGVGWATIVAAGALANYLEMWVAPITHRAMGASTAVFAALGLLSGFGWRAQAIAYKRPWHRWAPLIAGVCLLALLGAGSEHVDVLGHLLGFLVGLAVGWGYGVAGWPRTRNPRLQMVSAALVLTAFISAWAFGLSNFP